MKKVLVFLLCLAVILPIMPSDFNSNAAGFMFGDLSGDLLVSTTDYTIVEKALVSGKELPSDQLTAGDLDGNGILSASDLLIMETYILGKSDNICMHKLSDWTDTGIYNCKGVMTTVRGCEYCDNKTEKSTNPDDTAIRSIDGKTVMFIGNSFVYYGYCINKGSQGSADKGYFKQVCTANGENVTVLDYVWGGRNLDYIYTNYLVDVASSTLKKVDYVFISEAGENNSGLVSDINKIIKLFPSSHTKFFYLCHSYTYQAGHSNIKNAFSTLQGKGIEIVNWGQLVYNVWKGTESVPGATKSYSKTTFIVNKNDDYHQNMLSGYITAQMCYCALTGKSAVGQSYAFCTDTSINSKYDTASYISSYYNAGTTNFDDVFASASDMNGLQQLIDKYLKKYNFTTFTGGEHDYVAHSDAAYDGALAAAGLEEKVCTVCNTAQLFNTGTAGTNHMYISADTVSAAGYSTVKEYMLAGLGNVFYKTSSGWGRAGYSSIMGMATTCDGIRGSKGKDDGNTDMYWKIKSLTAAYNADGATAASGETAYVSLFGYDMTNSVTAKGAGIYFNKVNAPKSFDILGGVTAADGTITWKVLASFDSATDSYKQYDAKTVAFFADFNATQFDCVQVGIKTIDKNVFYCSEFELYA